MGQTATANARVAPARSGKITNLVSPGTAGTEFSHTLDSGTKQFSITDRSDGIVQVAFATGETNTKYKTIPCGNEWQVKDVDLSSFTLYMQCSGSSHTIEIVEWS